MNTEDFRTEGHKLIDWIANYYQNIESFPVKSQVAPSEIYNSLPNTAPTKGEPFEQIFQDFEQTILKGMTHWQHPSFFAYFTANTSFPSILGELLTSALGAQCMIWDTSPAAAELEQKVCNWLLPMLGLPHQWHGVIQDTASTATLVAILAAREQISNYNINNNGFKDAPSYTIYCSKEAHSSIEKGVKIAGIGKQNLRKIGTDNEFALSPKLLEEQIQADIQNGFVPLMVIGASGTTSSTAMDPLDEIAKIANNYNLWFHVDAAYAAPAAICPEYRWFLKGAEMADSFVFNPHKWMFVNFDCSILYVKDKDTLTKTFDILPEYLKTEHDKKVNNYRDWGIQLGRRFRALKLWFVIREFGIEGIQEKFREHMRLAQLFKSLLEKDGRFEIMAPVHLNLVCFRFCAPGIINEQELEKLNKYILDKINATGQAYITHTKLNGVYTLRFVCAQTNVTEKNVLAFWDLLLKTAGQALENL